MSDSARPARGSVVWTDLTVERAEQARDFYSAVVGWRPEPVEMGGYVDFNMTLPESGAPAAGVCHARGINAGLPPQWLIYITVVDIDDAALRCAANGGEVVVPPKGMGSQGRFCVIRDPTGAVAALFEPGARQPVSP